MKPKTPPWGANPIFEWDSSNEEHIWKHEVTVFEFEECFFNPYRFRPHRFSRSQPEKFGDRFIVIGETDDRRRLKLIIQYLEGSIIRPITAFDS